MEGKVAVKEFMEVGINPPSSSDHKDPPYMTEKPSIRDSLGSSLLTLSLPSQQPQQEHTLTQLGSLRMKLEEAKKENQNLKSMLSQITKHYSDLQNRLLSAMQQRHLLSSSSNYHQLQDIIRGDDTEKPDAVPTQKFLETSEPSASGGRKLSEGFTSPKHSVNKNTGSKLMSGYNADVNDLLELGAKNIQDKASGQAPCRRARVSIRERSDVPMIGDGCQWRKYGQKTAKGNPCPRAYYRCSMGTACSVRKQVQRCAQDENILITTYEGNHNHPLPPAARLMASTTSAALSTFLSGSTTSTTNKLSSNPGLIFPNALFSSNISTFSPSYSSCPTLTLDLTQPSNPFQLLRPNSLINPSISFPFPLQSEGLYFSSNLPKTAAPSENNLSLVDMVSAAIAHDPSFKAALAATISSFT